MRRKLTPLVFSLLAGPWGCVEENLPLLPEGGAGGETASPCHGPAACDGKCTNLDDDRHNCGACGHDCFGGSCDAGHCQPVAIATGELGANAIAADESHVYWGGNSIKRCALDGLDKETLSDSEQATPEELTIDRTHIYWTVFGGLDNVVRMPKEGGAEQVLAESQASPLGLAVDEESVYWASYDGDAILKTPLAGGEITTLAVGQYAAAYVAVRDGMLVWSNHGASPGESFGTIRSMPTTGGEPLTLATGQGAPHFVATNGTHAWWTAVGNSTVMRAPLDGGQPETLADDEQNPTCLLLDGNRLYWLRENAIRSTSSAGGDITTAYQGMANIEKIAQNKRSFYWIEPGDGTIMRLAKPL